MSEEQAGAFLRRAQTDSALFERLAAVKSVEERMQILKDEGYDCAPGEIVAAADKLSEKELAAPKGSAEQGREVNLRYVVDMFLEI